MQKTYSAKPGEVERKWYVVDLKDAILGRAATEIARILRGKNKPQFTPHVDTGDFVIAINADHVKLSGTKPDKKIYYDHTQYLGGLKKWTAKQLLAENSEKVVRLAVQGMLPKNHLGRELVKKLKIYAGAEHPHAAQMPQAITVGAQVKE
jgi:large subunit ribosomal protein L13